MTKATVLRPERACSRTSAPTRARRDPAGVPAGSHDGGEFRGAWRRKVNNTAKPEGTPYFDASSSTGSSGSRSRVVTPPALAQEVPATRSRTRSIPACATIGPGTLRWPTADPTRTAASFHHPRSHAPHLDGRHAVFGCGERSGRGGRIGNVRMWAPRQACGGRAYGAGHHRARGEPMPRRDAMAVLKQYADKLGLLRPAAAPARGLCRHPTVSRRPGPRRLNGPWDHGLRHHCGASGSGS